MFILHYSFIFMLQPVDALWTIKCVLCGFSRYVLSDDGEWLVKELGISVERGEQNSVNLDDVRKIQRQVSYK